MARAGWALLTTSTIYHLESSIIYLPSVVGPATELEFAFLIIKREPCNVYLARALKDARRYVEAAPSLIHHHVRLERAVELFVGAAVVVVVARGVVVVVVVVKVVVAAAAAEEERRGCWLVGCFTMHGSGCGCTIASDRDGKTA